MAILERIASKIAGKRDVLTPRDWKGEDTAPWTDAKILRPAGFAPEDYICTGCTACDAFPFVFAASELMPGGKPVVSLDPVRIRFKADTDRRRQEKKNLRKPDADLEDNLKSLAQYYKDSAIALARTMKKDWHKAESAVKGITQQTAAEAVGVSDSRISDYLNMKDYEDNAWVLAARFWHGLCADLQQLTIVADIIRTKLHHKLATIDKIDALSLYTQILPHFIAKCGEFSRIKKAAFATGTNARV